MITKVIRNGKEIEYLANEKYYDFNYQYLNFLQKPFLFQKVRKNFNKKKIYIMI